MPAMPVTTVRKITGAMIILTSLMKPSPSGFSAAPVAGQSQPTRMPERHGDEHLHVQGSQEAWAAVAHALLMREAGRRRKLPQLAVTSLTLSSLLRST